MIHEITITVLIMTLLAYWAWYSFLMHLGLVLREGPDSPVEALYVGIRKTPKAMFLGGRILAWRLVKG